VASFRAAESKRRDALFKDPFAEILTAGHEQNISNSMSSIARTASWSVVIRTHLIDEIILRYVNQGYKTLINLGSGLDTRPYRLALGEDFHWVEIDFPNVIDFKNQKLQEHQPNCKLERIALDLSNHNKRRELFKELNTRIGPALVLCEGVIMYLDEEAVSSLAEDIKEQSNFKLWIADYYSLEIYKIYQSPKFVNLFSNAPFLFFPADWFSFFQKCGWIQKEILYLYDIAKEHNRSFPLPWWTLPIKFIIGEKRMMKKIRKYTAFVIFEKK
jgi:methyltransferase (TIGR00027 family)